MSSRLIPTAQRATAVRYAVRDIVLVAREAEAAGKDLIYLNIGDPPLYGFRTPPVIVEAVCRAMRDNYTGYAPSEGLPSALEAIREDAEVRSKIKNPLDIFIGNGSSECIEVVLAALVNPGENVLVPCPGYPFYSAALAKLGCIERRYHLDEARAWQPDIGEIEANIDEDTRAIVLIDPNNPTGSVCETDVIERLLEVASRHNIVVFADQIYDRLRLDNRPHISAAALRPDVPVITFGGLSKAFLAPGLRLGWGIVSGPESRLRDLIPAIHRFLRARLSASHPVQWAVAPALHADDSFLTQTIAKLRQRRDAVVGGLAAIPGVSCVAPEAAFYAFPRLTLPQHQDNAKWVKELIRETGVVPVHGSGFGEQAGTSHFRIVFLAPLGRLTLAIERIKLFMEERC